MAIRYDKKLNQEINRIIKNFNQKIAKLEKQGRDLLPNKVSKKELTQISNRNELMQKLKELQRFSKRGAEEVITTKGGATLTRYELARLKKQASRVKQSLTKSITRMKVEKPRVLGKEQDVTYAEMGDKKYLNLLAKRESLEKNIESLSKEELESYKELVKKQIEHKNYMDNKFKENYLKMLTDLGYYVDYDDNKLEILKEKLLNLKSNDFVDLFEKEQAIKAILDYYPYVTGRYKNFNPAYIKEDVSELYDNLIDNIDEILKPYA